MKLNQTTGSYEISFFYITIYTEDKLNRDVIKRNESTFVHEFIHYLQDLVLPYNIRYSLTNVRKFYTIIKSAQKNKCITRPFNNWDEEISMQNKQLYRTFGEENYVNNFTSIENIESEYVSVAGYDTHSHEFRKHRVYEHFMRVYANDGKKGTYVLGARDLLEYIAYKIEAKYSPDCSNPPLLPYQSVDVIFEEYGLSDISEDIKICIAEFCLYNDAPIHLLLYTLLKNDGFVSNISTFNYDAVYEFLLNLVIVTRDNHTVNITSKAQRRFNDFIDLLLAQYDGFEEIKKWILRVKDYVGNCLIGRFIFSEIYRMNNDEMKEFINEVIHHIGIPMIINSNEECVSISTNKAEAYEFVQLYLLQKFVEFVADTEETKCPIYDFCKANGGVCNENCKLNSQNIIEGNEGCYYRKFMESRGLTDVKFE